MGARKFAMILTNCMRQNILVLLVLYCLSLLACSHTGNITSRMNRPEELENYFSKQALARAKTLSRAGETRAAEQELFDILKRYPNAQAAEDAALILIDWMVADNHLAKAKDFAWEFLIFHNKSDFTSRVRKKISQLDAMGEADLTDEVNYWAMLEESKEKERKERDSESIQADGLSVLKELPENPVSDFSDLKISKQSEIQVAELIREAPKSAVSNNKVVMLAKRSTDYLAPQTVGVILPLTGKFASYGQNALTAIRLGFGINNFSKPTQKITIDRVNEAGRSQLEVVIIDSEGVPEEAARAVNKLVSTYGVIGIIGDILQDTSVVVAERCEAYRVPLISLSRKENLNLIGSWVFRLGMTSTEQVKALLDFSYFKKGLKKYAVLYPEHTYGQEMADLFIQYINYVGGDVVHVESYNPKQTTFTNLAKKITNKLNLKNREDYQLCVEEANLVKNKYRRARSKTACRKGVPPEIGFEALFIPDFPKTVSYLVPALISSDVLVSDSERNKRVYKKSTGYKSIQPVQLLGGSSWNNELIGKRLGRQVDGAFFVDGFSAQGKKTLDPGLGAFVKNFKAIVSGAPKAIEFNAYDAAKICMFLLGQVDDFKPTSRLAFKESLDALAGFPGVVGSISFDSDGESIVPLQKFKFSGGKIEEVK